MPRYNSSMSATMAGIASMMGKGKDAYRAGQDAALKDALAMGQIENLQSQADTRRAEEIRKAERANAQKRLGTDRQLQLETALNLNGLNSALAGDVMRYLDAPAQQATVEAPAAEIPGITAAPVTATYTTPAALPAGIDETQLGKILRTQALLSSQYGLTGDTNAAQLASAQGDAMARADYEGAQLNPLAMTLYNAAQAAHGGKLYSDAGNGLTLSQDGGTQTVAAPELYGAKVDDLRASAVQSRAAAANSEASAKKTRWEMGEGGPGLGKITGVGQRYLSSVMQEDDGFGGIRNVSRLDPEKIQRFGRWAQANGKPLTDAAALEWAVAGSPDAGGAPAPGPAPAGAKPAPLRMENGLTVQPLVPTSNPDLAEFLNLYGIALQRGQTSYAKALELRAKEARLIQ